MQLVVGFEEEVAAQGPAFATHSAMRHRPARRQRSLLSESLQSGGSSSSSSSSSSAQLMVASSPLSRLRASGRRHSFATTDSDGGSEAASPSSGSPLAHELLEDEQHMALQHQQSVGSSWRGSEPMAIAYSRAARDRIAAAEEHGRKRAEQLEMLQAVRAYMSQAQAAKAALAAAAARHQQQQQQPACAM